MAWNGSAGNSITKKATSKNMENNNLHFVALVLIVLFVLGGAAYIWYSKPLHVPHNHESVDEYKDNDIAEFQPADEDPVPQAPVPKEEDGVRYTRNGTKIQVPRNPWGTPIPKDLEFKPHWEYTPEDYARIDPDYARKHEEFLKRMENNPWKTAIDSRLATLLFSKAGMPIASMPFTALDKERFLKSLETPIIATRDDSDEVREQKRQMNETKIWLKEKLDAGEDIIAILNEERDRQIRLVGIRNNLMQELREIEKNATSVQEVEDFVEAANIMLEEEGAEKVVLPTIMTKIRVERNLNKED